MPGQNLTRDEAEARAALVRVDSYEVELDVACGDTTFGTRSRVRFSAAEPGTDTFLDFIGTVEEVVLNGAALAVDDHYDGARVRLPRLAAVNDVTVTGRGRYMNTGEGLHRFVDPVDERVYLYSQFEVADCRRVFAVFEQPDLKATFAFTVTAPAHWQIVSTQPTPQPSAAGTGSGADRDVEVATWAFAPTPRLSCYVTSLVAGPYAVRNDTLTTGDGRVVPLRVLCRSSLEPYLDADAVLDVTRAGFAFYEREFGLAYPFDKYDQIFTPEFNAGAMENVGAVTYSEVYVFRAKVTEALVERRALTILHELAHMWFGNLVTMRWWDDLWLNESFAEWASTTCQAEATRWTSAWTTFGTAEKGWAYTQDQLSSTHPIVAPIRDLQDVEVNFDGITYAKGASVLKQLVAYVGRPAFTEALRRYFRAHAWGNTTLADFLAELERASGRDMGAWSAAWLQTAGVNTLRAEVDAGPDGAIARARLVQTAVDDHPVLRPHRLAVGLYDVRSDDLVRRDRVEFDAAGPSTPIPGLTGARVPDLLLVNDDDLAYAKIRLDERSLATALRHPRGFTDGLPRSLVLGAAWDMVRDAEMAGRDYVRLVLATLPGETDSTLLRVLLARLATTVRLYVAPTARAAATATLGRGLRDLAVAASPGSDAQLQLVTSAAEWARDQTSASWIRGLLDGGAPLPGLDVDTEMRWTLLTGLVAGGAASDTEIDAEQARDDTATGRERAALARAARPVPQAKADAWTRAVEEERLANQMVVAVGHGFVRVHDPELLRPYVSRYHDALLHVASSRTHAIAESIVEGFYPLPLADAELAQASQAWLDTHPEAPDALRRLVTERRDTVTRALAAQARDAAG